MKCPDCGFVSLSVLPQCENCGHRFPLLTDSQEQLPAEQGLESLERWPDELTQRVQKFRRRRANLRHAVDFETTLKFDFEETRAEDLPPAAVQLDAPQPDRELDVVLRADEEAGAGVRAVDSVALRRESEPLESDQFARADEEAAGPISDTGRQRRAEVGAIPIVTESPAAEGLESADVAVPAAPLGQRFLAGVVDGMVLLLALALFVGTFWWIVGGRMHLRAAHLAFLGFVVGFLVLSYFASFGRLAPATPGQRALGLTLHSLEGGTPTSGQALWRAFGYLVSCAALMLGFVWALVDIEGLTWHDRMSGTCLASRARDLHRSD